MAIQERTMRKFLFVLASTVILAAGTPAVAQYVFPPGYIVPGYMPPRYIAPGYIAPGYTNRGYIWWERRLYEDPGTYNSVQERQNYERLLNNAAESGSVGLTDPTKDAGECAIGFSEETCRRRGQKYNPPSRN